MAHELTDFLVSLSSEHALRAFLRNPEESTTEARLSAEQKNAVTTGNQQAIRYLCAVEMEETSLHAQRILSALKIADRLTDDDNDTNFGDTADDHDVDDDIEIGRTSLSGWPYYENLFGRHQVEKENELVIVGTGVTVSHMNESAAAYIASADVVFYHVADMVTERRIQLLNKRSEDLYYLYSEDKPRRQTYSEMVGRIVGALRANRLVCAVYYGHPGIFVRSSYEAVNIARREGYSARMLPALSSLDCLFSDIGVDPSRSSCQIVEATDLLVRGRTPDITASLIVLQAGCVGDLGFKMYGYDGRNVPILSEYLVDFYGKDHEIVLYEAAQYSVCRAKIKKIAIRDLVASQPNGHTTIYVPAKQARDRSRHMLSRLQIAC